jgi:ATP-dependent DNA ligase
MTFRPMLASPIEDISKLKYPIYASIKYDGIRATMQGGKLLSRTLKPIPNKNVQEMFKHLPEGFDGELMFGDPAAKDVFQLTTSVVMSHNKQAAGIKFYAFDEFKSLPFSVRMNEVYTQVFDIDDENVEQVQQRLIHNEKQLLEFEEVVLAAGFEGLILRSADGPYKEGRSTEKQGWLLKLKRFVDAEAEVLGTYEEMENTNEATTNALGRTERSTKKAGMVGKGTLGKFGVIGINGQFKGVEFECGSGLTADQRDRYWKTRKKLVGKIIKYKYFPIGVKDKPRLPIFLGFRDKRDI